MDNTKIAELVRYLYDVQINKIEYNINLQEKDIENFMAFYRSEFPAASVLPKMHIMEDHTIPWLQRWHLGAGMMGEQGAESIHSHMKGLEKNFRNIANEVERLKYLFKEQILEAAPSLTSLRPPPLKRRRKDESSSST